MKKSIKIKGLPGRSSGSVSDDACEGLKNQ